jgi:hypothetical protein
LLKSRDPLSSLRSIVRRSGSKAFTRFAARLSNCELFNPGEEAVLFLDGDVLKPGVAGVVQVSMAGYGWIQALWRSGDLCVVEATSSSKLIVAVDLCFLPVFWTAMQDQLSHVGS